jgi:hypothetical protein
VTLSYYTIQTTLNPGVWVNVDEDEYESLLEQDLIEGEPLGPFDPSVQDAVMAEILADVNSASRAVIAAIPPDPHTHTASQISDSTAIGRALMTASTDITARDAINAVADDDARLSDARTPTAHNHDDRYYTEAEMDTALAAKSDTGHTHDDRYFTESEVTAALGLKADSVHTHDVGDIEATGSPSSSTFLRGDGAWATIDLGDGSIDYADLPAGSVIYVHKSGASWPVRPTARTDIKVIWQGATPAPAIGGSGAVDGLDVYWRVP